MALLDLFRPKWRHSDREIRLAAVANTTNQRILRKVARSDDHWSVKCAAISHLDDKQLLEELTDHGNPSLRNTALSRLRELAQGIEGLGKVVRNVIADQLDLAEEDVTMEARVVEDLGADSLDLVEMTMTVEEALYVEIPDEDLEGSEISTVKDAIEYLRRHLEQDGGDVAGAAEQALGSPPDAEGAPDSDREADPDRRFEDFAAKACHSRQSLRIPLKATYPLVLELERCLTEVKDVASGDALDTARAGLIITCPRCGEYNDRARDMVLLGGEGGAFEQFKGVVYGGPNTAALAEGRCPGCSGEEVRVTFDPQLAGL